MLKIALKFIFALSLFIFLSAGTVNAASPLSIRLEEPKSPTNQDNFNIIFVTLDIQGRPITVKCFKKGPSDGSFTQFGSDISVSSGGNTGNCSVSSSIVNTAGTYQFYATAQAGSDSATSTTDTVDYNTSGPGTPTNYSKEKISSCTYRVKFKTADDGGKTVKAELYRSTNTSFSVDSGTKVDSINIGSNTEGQFENTVPDCDKTYYYAIRAFDSSGNGSGVVSDSVTTVTTTTVTSSSTAGGTTGGAIPVSQSSLSGGEGQVLGEESGEQEIKASEEKKEVLGTTNTPEPSVSLEVENINIPQEFPWKGLLGGIVALLVIYLGYRKFRK